MENKNITEENIDLLSQLESLIDNSKKENIDENEAIVVEPLSVELLEEENLEASILANQGFSKEADNTQAAITEKKE
jgi:hypothetical protein